MWREVTQTVVHEVPSLADYAARAHDPRRAGRAERRGRAGAWRS